MNSTSFTGTATLPRPSPLRGRKPISGDSTPLSNAALRQYVDNGVSDFVLCVDHVNVVKRTIVQDNLLRILFGERVDLVP